MDSPKKLQENLGLYTDPLWNYKNVLTRHFCRGRFGPSFTIQSPKVPQGPRADGPGVPTRSGSRRSPFRFIQEVWILLSRFGPWTPLSSVLPRQNFFNFVFWDSNTFLIILKPSKLNLDLSIVVLWLFSIYWIKSNILLILFLRRIHAENTVTSLKIYYNHRNIPPNQFLT